MNETLNIIILAAGNSSRLGYAKQSLMFKGKTLLQHTASEALAADARVIVVTGANSEVSQKALAGLNVLIQHNNLWQDGMSASIRAGLDLLLQTDPHVPSAVFAVCDQPFVTAQLFRRLAQTQQETGKGIVAAAYSDTAGTPVLFTGKYFNDLSKLTGQQGARKLLSQHPGDVAGVEFEDGIIDIDTKEDYERLTGKSF